MYLEVTKVCEVWSIDIKTLLFGIGNDYARPRAERFFAALKLKGEGAPDHEALDDQLVTSNNSRDQLPDTEEIRSLHHEKDSELDDPEDGLKHDPAPQLPPLRSSPPFELPLPLLLPSLITFLHMPDEEKARTIRSLSPFSFRHFFHGENPRVTFAASNPAYDEDQRLSREENPRANVATDDLNQENDAQLKSFGGVTMVPIQKKQRLKPPPWALSADLAREILGDTMIRREFLNQALDNVCELAAPGNCRIDSAELRRMTNDVSYAARPELMSIESTLPAVPEPTEYVENKYAQFEASQQKLNRRKIALEKGLQAQLDVIQARYHDMSTASRVYQKLLKIAEIQVQVLDNELKNATATESTPLLANVAKAELEFVTSSYLQQRAGVLLLTSLLLATDAPFADADLTALEAVFAKRSLGPRVVLSMVPRADVIRPVERTSPSLKKLRSAEFTTV
ncbi:hypothetical protein CMUS01_09549 [Colletotrichum musicola]|uniref:Uncharacterized protein n=2 Tax=Colletotrichum orchidearum species complex TaxID=2707337 RepID=A0A8H6K6Y6_9PEZI|nr:hypothetical protein CMUS01_09549 [Colletotrichum musicola]